MQMLKHGFSPHDIEHIFISHLHGDHFFGLPGLLSTFLVTGRSKPLSIWHPGQLDKLIYPMIMDEGTDPESFPFELSWPEFDATKKNILLDHKSIRVSTFPLKHSVPTAAFIIDEKPAPRKMIAERIEEFAIPFTAIESIKEGNDFVTPDGRTVSNRDLTLDPEPPRRLVYVSDTGWFEELPEMAGSCDLLIHEATFSSDIKTEKLLYHCTAKQAAATATRSGAHKLVINHISTRNASLSKMLAEARQVFKNTVIGEEGKTFDVRSGRE